MVPRPRSRPLLFTLANLLIMLSTVLLALAVAVPAACAVPSLEVPACPAKGTIKYDKSVPDQKDFPATQVDLCYDDKSIRLDFTANDEVNFYFNSSYGTNDNIWEYEVMEAFIYHGTKAPRTYLEFEVAPNNVTYQAFVYNPSKVRADGAPFDHFFITDPLTDGLDAETTLDKNAKTWVSSVRIPLALFNVNDGHAKGTKWRMNFFRTVVSPHTFPDQLLGAWSPADKASFHITPLFGHVTFV